MGDDGVANGQAESGIETLVVMLGANNALGSVVKLEPKWTPDSYGQLPFEQRMTAKNDLQPVATGPLRRGMGGARRPTP